MFTKLRNLIRFGIAFFIIAVLTVIVMDQIVMPLYVSQGETITLQDVRNQSFSRAKTKLNEMGLQAVVLDSVNAPDLPPYTVVDQQPLPGNLVKNGRAVFLTISKGREYVQMPNLLGMAEKEAQLLLDQMSLRVKTTENKYDYDKPEGTVCGQSINPGMLVAKHSALKIWISNGPPVKSYTVPDVIGLSMMAAKKKIRDAGLQVGDIDYMPNNTFTPLTVINQRPKKNTTTHEVVRVSLEVTTTQ
jgi:beta-lactam-binding protein with PASTA domain